MTNLVLQTIQNRRSIRKFKTEQISEQELQTILDAGIQAPSANNSQSWHFTVVQNQEMIKYMSNTAKAAMVATGEDKLVSLGQTAFNIFYNAPTVIIVSGSQKDGSALVNCGAAIENMLLAAESINLGACWIGFVKFFFANQEGVKKLQLPENYQPFYAVAIGYKAEGNASGPGLRNKDVVNYIK